MSWSVTIDNLQEIPDLPDAVRAKLSEDNPAYEEDAVGAFVIAKAAGLVSATLSGGRTPNPYGGAEVVVIAITGFDSDKVGRAVAKNFTQTMQQTVTREEDIEVAIANNELDWDEDSYPDTTW